MKKLAILLSILMALASCSNFQENLQVGEFPIDLNFTFETKAGSGDATAEPVINCMRVLIFYGVNSEDHETDGNLVFNTFYAFGFNTTRQTGKYNVALANQIVLPQSDCRNYNIYVVLNEEGFTLSGATPEDLHTKLGDFEGNETALRNILSTPAVYTEVLKNADEPAFLISGSKAVTFGEGELGSGKSVTVDGADGFNRGRSMAQIVINKITSEPAPKSDGTAGDDYTSSEVPLIFVKSVTLENVPNAISWSNDDGKIGTVGSTTVSAMTAVPVGAAKNHTDGSGEYYDRDWYGHITRTISNLYAQKAQYTDAQFYRTYKNEDITGEAGNNGKNKLQWSFNVKPYRTSDNPTSKPPVNYTPWTYEYAAGKDYKTPENVKPAEAINAVKGVEAWDKGDAADKSGGVLLAQLPEVFAAKQDGNDEIYENISYTSYEVTGIQADGGNKTTISSATLSADEYWTVRLGDKFYVPENIQSATANATCLHVTLAIANPKFSFSLNKDKGKRIATEDCNNKDTGDKVKDDDYQKGYNYVDPTTLPAPSLLPDEDALAYTYYAGDSETGNLKLIKEIDGNWIKTYGHVVWADDETHNVDISAIGNNECDPHTYDSETGTGGYHIYIDGFSRRTGEVQTSIVVNETLRGSSFSWNVPASDDATTHVYNFVIPINNNLGGDGDYSVRRNTRYTVTLYVNQATYTNLSTKAGESAPFTITAKVTTEQVNCDEE